MPLFFSSVLLATLTFGVDGSWDVAGYQTGAIPIGAEGELLSESRYVDHRLRFSPWLDAGNGLVVRGELDLLRGPLAGDTTPYFPYLTSRRDSSLGVSPDSIDARQLYAEWTLPAGTVRAGQMAANWGLGLMANDARGASDWSGPRFHGDLVDRVLFATRPFALASRGKHGTQWLAFVGADMVYRDQSAEYQEGDRAYQGVFGFAYAPKTDNNRAGLYAVRRSQTDRYGFDLNVWALDFHGRYEIATGTTSKVRFEAEVAQVLGTTSMSRDAYDSTRDVTQTGAATEIAFASQSWEAVLQSGYASGDSNPYDDRVLSFEFDPEYQVGFILFREVLAWQTAASAAGASDPEVMARSAPGAQLLPTEGAVTNAIYVAPTVRTRLPANFSLAWTLLWARSATDFVDPYVTNVNGGGYPLTIRGATPDSRDLGFEADIGVRWKYQRDDISGNVGLAYGRFFPGAAFNAPVEGSTEPENPMEPVDRVMANLGLSW